jgi:hypothetical protein
VLGYSGIHLPMSGCVRFVVDCDFADTLRETVVDLKSKGVVCGYVDYMDIRRTHERIGDHIAAVLKLPNAPYRGPISPWVPFLDDLIALSARVNGLVLVIDNAGFFLENDRDEAFALIEAFLIQFHHWLEKKKPCHLCFQMEKNELIRQVFYSA